MPNNENIFGFTSDGKTKLPGFKFKISEVEHPEHIIETDITDEKGQVVVRGLKANVLYEISEIDMHDEDYATNKTKYRFKINEKTQILDEQGNPFIESGIVFANSKRTEPETISLPVSKEWLDQSNQAGNRPESIMVRLYADGEKTDQTIILSAAHDWRGSFKALKQYKNGKEIEYTIKEENVPAGYEAQVVGNQKDGYQIINRYIPEKPTTTNTTNTTPTTTKTTNTTPTTTKTTNTTPTTAPTTMPAGSEQRTTPTTRLQPNTPKTAESIVIYQYCILCTAVLICLGIVRIKKAGHKEQ